MAVNIDAMFLVAREIGGRMAKRQRGSIIQTSSIYGVVAPDPRIYEGSQYLESADQYATCLFGIEGSRYRANASPCDPLGTVQRAG